MQRTHTLRNRLLAAAAFAVVLAATPSPACAASKEIIELQAQVQQLENDVQRIQSTLDTRFGVLQNLVQQTADNANQMTATVNALQVKIAAQSDAMSGKLDTASGQVQSLNDSVDELKSRIAKLDKSIQDLQTQLQNIQNPPSAAPPAAAPVAAPPAGQVPGQVPGQAASVAAPADNSPADAAPASNPAVVPASMPAVDQRPPLKETFQAGVRDYNAAKYDVAIGEFQDVVRYYPLDDLTGTSQFYLGEIAYRRMRLTDAVKSYNAVLEGFPGNPKAPAAQLRKGLALLQMNRKDAGVHELRALIQRHPLTPEAAQARTKLNGLGVKIVVAH
jgi:TolA-binding protein